jgi:hypothetical protein
MYTIEFWGGPRDGDEVYQVVKPCEHYWPPVDPPYSIAEFVKTPVIESILQLVESHCYILEWKSDSYGIYVYKGIVNKGL